MRFFKITLLLSFVFNGVYFSAFPQNRTKQDPPLFPANHPYIQYTGRIDFSNPLLPRFWSPGVYISAKFKGSNCTIVLNDEVLWGTSHNYITIVVDNNKPIRLQTTAKNNLIELPGKLSNGEHTVTICKATESGIGYLEFAGIKCNALVQPTKKPTRKIEFIGNSITCGMGSDLSKIDCDKGQWYDQHNAYQSYGPTVARSLTAQWQLTAVSGIGLMHSCCNMKTVMPKVFDKINMREDLLQWNFKNYIPDVVTVCLGQNDGIQDSTAFCTAYVNFLNTLRSVYPDASIICITSPMADSSLSVVLKNYLSAVVAYKKETGDKDIYSYFFSKRYNHGCGDHPDLNDHQQIAKELTAFIKMVKQW